MIANPNIPNHFYVNLAECLSYPSSDYLGSVDKSLFIAESLDGDIQKAILDFSTEIQELSVEDIQELYTRTFDVAPICTPLVSIHLYGEENFKRGQLMARFKEEFDKRGFDNGTDLPDHIGVLLHFAAFLNNEERFDLFKYCLVEPLAKMFDVLDKAGNPYCRLISAIQLLAKEELRKEETCV